MAARPVSDAADQQTYFTHGGAAAVLGGSGTSANPNAKPSPTIRDATTSIEAATTTNTVTRSA